MEVVQRVGVDRGGERRDLFGGDGGHRTRRVTLEVRWDQGRTVAAGSCVSSSPSWWWVRVDPPTAHGIRVRQPAVSGPFRRPAASTTGTTPTPSVPTAAAPVATTAPEPVFVSRIDEIGPDVRARMDGRSMRPGCPVGYDGLVLLTMSHVGFDGADHTGELVVHRDVADDVVSVFRSLHDQRFPIRRMTLVDDFGPGPTPAEGADDERVHGGRQHVRRSTVATPPGRRGPPSTRSGPRSTSTRSRTPT